MTNKEVIKYKKFIFTQSGLQLFTHIYNKQLISDKTSMIIKLHFFWSMHCNTLINSKQQRKKGSLGTKTFPGS